jgi:hypothetical protein
MDIHAQQLNGPNASCPQPSIAIYPSAKDINNYLGYSVSSFFEACGVSAWGILYESGPALPANTPILFKVTDSNYQFPRTDIVEIYELGSPIQPGGNVYEKNFNKDIYVRFLRPGRYRITVSTYGPFCAGVLKIIDVPDLNNLSIGNLSGPTTLACNSGGTVTYSIPPIPGATDYAWSASGNLQFIVRTPGIPSIDVGFNPSGIATGNLTVRATVCGTTVSRSFTINRSPATINNIITGGNTEICKNRTFLLTSQAASAGATNYTWTISQGSSGIYFLTSTNQPSVEVGIRNATSGSAQLTCAYTEPCTGRRIVVGTDVAFSNCTTKGPQVRLAEEKGSKKTAVKENTPLPDDTLSIYPNPANSFVYIHYPGGDKSYKLQLFNGLSQPVREATSSSSVSSLKVSDMPDGFYVLLVIPQSGPVIRRRIVIQH